MNSFLEERLNSIEPRTKDWRTPYERDFGRIMHSSSFRRLQGKTQVMGIDENDFHRTRLTHSLEVAQIGVSLAKALKNKNITPKNSKNKYWKELDEAGLFTDLTVVVNTACHAHDLGHPPFGHCGERTLHSKMMMKDSATEVNSEVEDIFEGNAQTLRLLTKLEVYDRKFGINPTLRTILSILKYPVESTWYTKQQNGDSKPPKCIYKDNFEQLQELMHQHCKPDFDLFTEASKHGNGEKSKHMSLDASIMNCADDIAYPVHDLEDFIGRKLLTKDALLDVIKDPKSPSRNNKYLQKKGITEKFWEDLFKDKCMVKKNIGHLINLAITTTYIQVKEEFEHPIFKYTLQLEEHIKSLLKYINNEITLKIVKTPEIFMLERKGALMIEKLFDEYMKAPHELIPNWDKRCGANQKRKVCDYIAGMTDRYMTKMYQRLFMPGIGSSRDEL